MNIYRNSYFSLRHGHSVLNDRGIIVSDPVAGKETQNRLTDWGREQVKKSVREALERKLFGDRTVVIVSSPFSRALESAMIAQEIMGHSTALEVFEDLRERFFGALEGCTTMAYLDVWDRDRRDPGHQTADVETAAAVLARMRGVIDDLERTRSGAAILLASHGDSLQILETSFRAMDPSLHRTLKPLENAEIRLLNP